ncbi:MAG: nucleotidyltransferase domain-containing protein [archaeon]
MTKKHKKLAAELTKEYSKDKNVVGIYIFGSLAKRKARKKSDLDIEFIFKKRNKPYELYHKKVDGIGVDFSMYALKQFKEDFSKKIYAQYASLPHKIMYDPKGILKKYLRDVKEYFKKNPKILKLWEDKERVYKRAKKTGGKKENYFEICKELEREVKQSSKPLKTKETSH